MVQIKYHAAHALHDTTEVSIRHNAFMVDVSGTLSCKFADDSSASLFPCAAGVVYPGVLLLAKNTGTTGPTVVTLLRLEGR